ncbi:MAG: glycosyltransferase family 4 protein [Siphonobacter sp.]
MLLRFLKKLRGVPDYQFRILLRHGGALTREFEKLAPTYHWYHRESNSRRQQVSRLFNRQSYQDQVFKEIKNENYDLIVSNTITNGDLLVQLRSLVSCPIVTYVHEMPMGISMYTEISSFNQTLRLTDYFWACSDAQRAIYINRFGLDPECISVLPSLLPEGAWQMQVTTESIQQIKSLLEIPDSAPIVGAVGTLDWRKGIDIFVQLARLSTSDTHFVWVGADEHKVEYQMIMEDIRRLGIHNRVHLVPHSDRPYDYIAAFDVFVLTSREEPYPLVVLEAALLGKPIVCFDQSGGAPDFVETDAGFICNYLDIAAMHTLITQLLMNATLRHTMGLAAREKVFARHQDDHAMRVFIQLIEKTLSTH